MICQGCCVGNDDNRMIHALKGSGYFLGSSLLAIVTVAVVILVIGLVLASIGVFGLYIYIGTLKPITLLYLIPLGLLSCCCKLAATVRFAIKMFEILPAIRDVIDSGMEKSRFHFVKTFT